MLSSASHPRRRPGTPLLIGLSAAVAVGLVFVAMALARQDQAPVSDAATALPAPVPVPVETHELRPLRAGPVTGWRMYEPLVGVRDVAVDAGGLVWVSEQDRGVVGTFAGETFTRYLMPDVFPDSGAFSFAPGPGGMWFSGYSGGSIGRVLPDERTANLFASLEPGSATVALAEGPEGVMWVTDVNRGKIIRIGTDPATVNDLPVPPPGEGDRPGPYDIVRGPDDSMWFTDPALGTITRIVTDGPLDMIPRPVGNGRLGPRSMAVAGEEIWITLTERGALARFEPVTGEERIVPVRGATGTLNNIAVAPDGTLWLTQTSDRILHVRPDGSLIRAYRIPGDRPGADGIAVAPDGTVWAAAPDANMLVQITP